jgi:Tol biopolymer transport system component
VENQMKNFNSHTIALLVQVIVSLTISQCTPLSNSITSSKSQTGIEQLKNISGNSRLLWSPTENVIIGSETNASPCPDWGCSQVSKIFLIDLGSDQKTTILELEQYGLYVRDWSSDGKQIMFRVEGEGELAQGIWSFSLDEGKESLKKTADHLLVSWSYDGAKLAAVDTVDESGERYRVIDVVDVQTGQKKQVYKNNTPESDILSLSWSSDMESIAFSYYDQKSIIYILRLRTGEIVEIENDNNEYVDAIFSSQGNFIALKKHIQGFSNDTVVIKDLTHNCHIELPVDNVKLLGSWSPDGAKFVFSTYDNDVYIVDLQEFLGFDFQKSNSLCP